MYVMLLNKSISFQQPKQVKQLSTLHDYASIQNLDLTALGHIMSLIERFPRALIRIRIYLICFALIGDARGSDRFSPNAKKAVCSIFQRHPRNFDVMGADLG